MVALCDVLHVDRSEQPLQIGGFLLISLHCDGEGKAAVGVVLLPGVFRGHGNGGAILGEGQREDVDFIPAAAKFGDDIGGEEFGVAPGDIDVYIRIVEQIVEHGLSIYSRRVSGSRNAAFLRMSKATSMMFSEGTPLSIR